MWTRSEYSRRRRRKQVKIMRQIQIKTQIGEMKTKYPDLLHNSVADQCRTDKKCTCCRLVAVFLYRQLSHPRHGCVFEVNQVHPSVHVTSSRRSIIKSDHHGDEGPYIFFPFLFNACMRAQCRKSILLGNVMIKFQLTVYCDPSWRIGSLVWFFVLSEDALQI